VPAAALLLAYGFGKPRMPIEHSGETSVRYVVRSPAVAPTAEAWLQTYAPKPVEPA
jgi:hypothetical protein